MVIVEIQKPEGRRVAEGAERFDTAVLDDGLGAVRREAAFPLPALHAWAAQGERQSTRHGMVPQGGGIPQRQQYPLPDRSTGRRRDGLLVAEIVRQRTLRRAGVVLGRGDRVVEASGLLASNACHESQGVKVPVHDVGLRLDARTRAIAADDRGPTAIHPVAGVQRLMQKRASRSRRRRELVGPALIGVGERIPRQQNPRPFMVGQRAWRAS